MRRLRDQHLAVAPFCSFQCDCIDRETEIQRDTETERRRDRQTERQRDRETERQRNREAERQRVWEHGETERQ